MTFGWKWRHFAWDIRQMCTSMLSRTITVQFPSEVYFVIGDDLTTSLSNPADPKLLFSARWHGIKVVLFKATALHWWKSTQWQSSRTVKCNYAADDINHLLTAGHNSFPKHLCTKANKTHSVFHLSEYLSACVYKTFIFLSFSTSKLMMSVQDKVQSWTLRGQFDKGGKS